VKLTLAPHAGAGEDASAPPLRMLDFSENLISDGVTNFLQLAKNIAQRGEEYQDASVKSTKILYPFYVIRL
jgi:hypothetical protein